MTQVKYPATCNKCGKTIDRAIPVNEDNIFICDDCKNKEQKN